MFSRCTLTHPPLPPPSSEGPIFAPRALSPKWTLLDLPCASWLAVYIGLCYQLAFALTSLSIVSDGIGIVQLLHPAWRLRVAGDGATTTLVATQQLSKVLPTSMRSLSSTITISMGRYS